MQMMTRLFFVHLITVLAIKVLISPNSSSNGSNKYLDNSVRLVKSSLRNTSNISWTLDFDGKKFRFRTGKYYLGINKNNYLIKKDGGKKLEDFDEEERLRELKELLDGGENKDDSSKRSAREDDEADKKGNTESDELTSKNSSKDSKSSSNSKNSNKDSKTSNNKNKYKNDSIVEKDSNLLSSFTDPSLMNTSQLIDTEGVFDLNTAFEKAAQTNLAESTEDDTRKETTSDTKPKIELLGNDFKRQDNGSNILSSSSSKSSTSSSTTTKSSTTDTYKSKGPGHIFTLVPIFNNRVDKKVLIVKDDMCLVHDLIFKKCSFSQYWNLSSEYYWDVPRVEDTEYMDLLNKALASKSNQASDMKKKQFINLQGCPSTCPSGNCQQSSESEEDSVNGSLSKPIPNSNPPINYNPPYNQEYNQQPNQKYNRQMYGVPNQQQFINPGNPNIMNAPSSSNGKVIKVSDNLWNELQKAVRKR